MSAEAEPKPTTPATKRANCSQCGGERNCNILGSYDDGGSDGQMDWNTKWSILQCCGCDFVFAQTVSTHSEDYDHYYDPYTGEEQTQYNEVVKYWPALAKRKTPDWISELYAVNAGKLVNTLSELYGALGNDLVILAAIGVRTSFDVASELIGIDPNLTFDKKLDELVGGGRIGARDRDRLATLVDAGNASAHRGWEPKIDDLQTMTDILEHFIHDAFIAPARKAALDTKAAAMREGVPTRPKRTTPNQPADADVVAVDEFEVVEDIVIT